MGEEGEEGVGKEEAVMNADRSGIAGLNTLYIIGGKYLTLSWSRPSRPCTTEVHHHSRPKSTS